MTFGQWMGHMSYPCMVISSIIGSRQRILVYTEVSYPTMYASSLRMVSLTCSRISDTCVSVPKGSDSMACWCAAKEGAV